MIKILAACGAGVNSSHQIKSALEEELSSRGYDVHCDAVMVKDVIVKTRLSVSKSGVGDLVFLGLK